MSKARSILLIEDSDTQALLLTELLGADGSHVDRVASAEDGLEYLQTHRPDLLVVDYNLPGMQGDEFCRRIRENPATENMALLILTADTHASAEQRGLECGADDYVAKSTDRDVLLARVNLLLRRSRPGLSSASSETGLFKTQRIMLVGDRDANLALLGHDLEHEGYAVITASTCTGALELFPRLKADCVVIDDVRQELDSFELCRRISKLRDTVQAHTPIVMITVKASKEKTLEAFEAGADDLIDKLADTAVLKSRMRALLRRKIVQEEHDRINRELRQKELALVNERAERVAAEVRAEFAAQLEIANAELAKANEDLKLAHVQLLQTEKMASLGKLVAGIAHEVNNPLAYSIGHLDTVAAALTFVTDEAGGSLGEAASAKLSKARQRTDDAASGLLRVQDLVAKLRSFSRLDQGTFQQTNMRECIESALPFIRHQLNGGIEIETRYAETGEVYCAAGLINQVVLNLLGNAIDAVGKTGKIMIETRRDGDDFCLTVGDSGPGISDDLKSRIFEPFFTTKEVGKGTGMGLAISYQIIERHGGRIEIGTSRLGGAEFAIRIPFAGKECSNAA